MATAKRKTVPAATKRPPLRVLSLHETELRKQALVHAINVSGIESYGGSFGGQIPQMSGSRSRYEAPAAIVKTAETFLSFLLGR